MTFGAIPSKHRLTKLHYSPKNSSILAPIFPQQIFEFFELSFLDAIVLQLDTSNSTIMGPLLLENSTPWLK